MSLQIPPVMSIFVVQMGGSETHILAVVGRIVTTLFFWATQMMTMLPGLHYSRWLLRAVAVPMHPLSIVIDNVYHGHLKLGCTFADTCTWITQHKEIKLGFWAFRKYNLFGNCICSCASRAVFLMDIHYLFGFNDM